MVHCPEHRHHLSFRGRSRSILTSTAQTPSILDETLRACVYLGETFPCLHRLAYVECSSPAVRSGAMPEHRLKSTTLYHTPLPTSLEVPPLITLPVCFDEAHSRIFEHVQNWEFTSPTVSAWVSWTVARRYNLGVELETAPRCQLFSKRFVRGPDFSGGRLPASCSYRWACLYFYGSIPGEPV